MMEPVGLYIHIPFCRKRCKYCDFFTIPSLKLLTPYLQAVKKEISLYCTTIKKVDTIYLGGGTPSILGVKNLEVIMDEILKSFDVSAKCEISLEANPDDISKEFIQGISKLGINRVVLGIQSFDDAKLNFLGRGYSGSKVRQALEILRVNFRGSCCLDMIYGTVFDNWKFWEKELNSALSYFPDHISCYELTIHEKTVFSRFKRNDVKLDDNTFRGIYLNTSRYLSHTGYIHYEVSNYALGIGNICRHNMKYWKRLSYVGIGPSAHSFMGKERWWNVSSLRKYIKLLASGELPTEAREVLGPGQEQLEYLALGLRTKDGVSSSVLSLNEYGFKRLGILEKEGYIHLEGGKILPTPLGYLVSDSLPVEILD